MVGRTVQNYAVLSKILNEINVRDENFKPQTLFDFGSGLGTVMWATSEIWSNSMKEYLCVEISKPMIELSEKLAKAAKPKIKNVFYREYFPLSTTTYDIVVSAFSLFELFGTNARLEVILNLWQKTEHYLIIVEQGTNAGYKLVNEARDFILKYAKSRSKSSLGQEAYVFSPCPHDLMCPRFVAFDNTPCNFEVLYQPLPFLDRSKYKPERYSYVVLKKGKRPENDSQWPRIVRATLHRHKHTICRMCVASGQLKEEIFTKSKHGMDMYRCARNSEWGDRLPIHYKEQENILKGDDTANEGTPVE
ncbi:Protein RSM22-like protein, mitochondrial [Harpegnathos saltator]|uniref:Protein RSM22-like protein, mitochondrial n=2 Tax=Harpegnathos saltator TaxID=610380 RepID=E2C7Z7_HARSA|nr:Protein RSM22-like protein, mitochondrial [Harpegnathos saltator]